MAENTGLHPAGWFTDPSSPDRERWWDGTGWTEQYREPEVTQTAFVPRAPRAYDPMEDWHANNRGTTTLTPLTLRSSTAGASTLTRVSGSDAHTPASWFLAITPLINGALEALLFFAPNLFSAGIAGTIAAAGLSVTAMSVWMDRAELTRRGLPVASFAWFLIPLIYLIRRAVVLKRVGVKANAPWIFFVVSAVVVGMVTSSVFAFSGNSKVNETLVHSFESKIASTLAEKLGSTWTVDCPDDAAITTSGTTFTCDGRNATGSGVRVDILVDGNSYRITNATELATDQT